MVDKNKLYTITESAEIFKIARKTMELLIKNAPIEYVNLNKDIIQSPLIRIKGSTLNDFIASRVVNLPQTGRKEIHAIKKNQDLFRISLQRNS